jgi:cytochrome c biogenesis protein CcdA
MSMVATGFATCGHDRRRLAAYDLGQLLGGAAGGSLVGVLLGAVALVVAVQTREALVVAAVAAGALVVVFAIPRARVCSRRLSRSRQVPQRWARRPPGTAGALYGFVLGTGFATPSPAPWPQLLAIASLASGSLVAAWAAWTAYGVARALAPVVTRRLGVDSNGIAGFTDRTGSAMRASGALASVAAACLSLIRL